MSRSTSLFGNALIEAPYIPGHETQGVGSFSYVKAFARVHGQETMDIGPADHDGDQGNQGPEPMGGKENADAEKTTHRKQQKRESKSQQGNEPPFSGMEERIGAGQQEKDDGNHV
jgi:hypothetical protein